MIYNLQFHEIEPLSLFVYDFQPRRHLLCYKTPASRGKAFGIRRAVQPEYAFVGCLRVLEKSEEDVVLAEIASRISLYVSVPYHPHRDHEIAVPLWDHEATIARITFSSYTTGLLDVCMVYHEITSVIASRPGASTQ